MTKSFKPLMIALAVVAGGAALSACETPAPEGGVRIDNQNDVRPTLNTVRVIDATLARYKNLSKTKVDSLLDCQGEGCRVVLRQQPGERCQQAQKQ